mgnify:CR=1 FL=1
MCSYRLRNHLLPNNYKEKAAVKGLNIPQTAALIIFYFISNILQVTGTNILIQIGIPEERLPA